MVKQTSSETAGRVLALRSLHLSYDKIKKQMFDDHILISRNAIIRIIKRNQCEQGSVPVNPRKFGFQNGRTVRSPALIRKVSVACAKRNPPTQRNLAARHGVSKATIWRILKEDLEWNARKKRKTHEVTPEQAVQRLERGHDFLEYLGKYKTRMIFTMDETYVTLNDFNGERDIYYQGKEVVVPPSWKKKSQKAWPKRSMVAIRICWEGTSRAYIVPQKSKVNSAFFIEHILQPMVEKDIPRLYGNKAKDVTLHMDSAPAHVSRQTVQWLEDRKIKFVPKAEWMANSPDLAPLDYGVNGIFKKMLSARRVTTVNGMEKAIYDVWSNFNIKTVRKILSSWKSRVEHMIERKGFQIEQIRK